VGGVRVGVCFVAGVGVGGGGGVWGGSGGGVGVGELRSSVVNPDFPCTVVHRKAFLAAFLFLLSFLASPKRRVLACPYADTMTTLSCCFVLFLS